MAASVTSTIASVGIYGAKVITFTWTAAADGSVPSTAITAGMLKQINNMNAVLAVVNPGATAPTAEYGITLTDADGADVFGGALLTRSASASEQARPAIATLAGKRKINSLLTFNVADNLVDSAVGVVKFYFTK